MVDHWTDEPKRTLASSDYMLLETKTAVTTGYLQAALGPVMNVATAFVLVTKVRFFNSKLISLLGRWKNRHLSKLIIICRI